MTERNERFRELLKIKERRAPELLRRKGVLGVGVGRDEVVVLAERGVSVEREIDGKPVRVIRTGKIRMLNERIPRSDISTKGETIRTVGKSHFANGVPFESVTPTVWDYPVSFPPPNPGGTILDQQAGIISEGHTKATGCFYLYNRVPILAQVCRAGITGAIKYFDLADYDIYDPNLCCGPTGVKLTLRHGWHSTEGSWDTPGFGVHYGLPLATAKAQPWKCAALSRFELDKEVIMEKDQPFVFTLEPLYPAPQCDHGTLAYFVGKTRDCTTVGSRIWMYVHVPKSGSRWFMYYEGAFIFREWVIPKETEYTKLKTRGDCEAIGGYWWKNYCHCFPEVYKPALPTPVPELPPDLPPPPEDPDCGPRHKKWRPAPPGVQIGNVDVAPGWGTFGAVVIKNGKKMMLSCSHVLAYYDRGKIGDNIAQPFDQSAKIAKLYQFVSMQPAPNVMIADCAIAEPNRQEDIVPGILTDGPSGPTIIPTGVVDPYVGMKVKKSGARTGFVRKGEITAINVAIDIETPIGTARHNNAIMSTIIGASGDSGSLVLDDSTNEAVGLLFAGSETLNLHSPMKSVLSALGCTLYTEGEPPYVPPIKTYIECTTTPTSARIWLKKH